MSEPELEQPRMVWVGPLPAHMRHAEEPSDAEGLDDGEFVERFEGAARHGPTLLIAGVALAVGIGIGALSPLVLRVLDPPLLATPIRAAQVVLAPAPSPPAPSPAVETALPQAVEPTSAAADEAAPAAKAAAPPTPSPAAPAHRAARHSPAHAAKLVRAAATTTPAASRSPCDPSSGRADLDACAQPMVTAADQDLKRAYRQALNAGVSPEVLRADLNAWQREREDAARKGPIDLVAAYSARIARVETMASEAPH